MNKNRAMSVVRLTSPRLVERGMTAMKLKMGDAHNLYAALVKIDGDEKLKLKDEVRLSVSINIGKLEASVRAYEKLRQQKYLEMRQKGINDNGQFARDEAIFNAEFTQSDILLRDAEHEFGALSMITLDDLKPTKGEHFISNKSALRPIIKDWPEPADEEAQS